MQQTLRDVEYIFVDDATSDDSIGILKEVVARYPGRKGHVKILNHEQNLGLPAARNTGLAMAQGEYIFHCDSDDYADPEMLETLYNAAVANKADMVWCDWYLTFATSERYMRQPAYTKAQEALRAMLSGGMKYNVWNKLVRRALYTENHIEFPAGYGMGEDLTMIRLASCAQRVAYVPHAFYHYVKTNTQSFCQTHSVRHLRDLRHNVDATASFVLEHCGSKWEREVSLLKLEAKYPFLISDGRQGEYDLWRTWYPEANAYIWQNSHVSVRSRVIQWLAVHESFTLVRLYNRVAYRYLYGIIYGR